jgi:hypothetical protein
MPLNGIAFNASGVCPNKQMNSKQLTVAFHVDDLKVSLLDQFFVSFFLTHQPRGITK